MTANDLFIAKIVDEYRKAIAKGIALNWREIAGRELLASNLDPVEAIAVLSAKIAAGNLGKDSIEHQAACLLVRVSNHRSKVVTPGMKQVAMPEAAVATTE